MKYLFFAVMLFAFCATAQAQVHSQSFGGPEIIEMCAAPPSAKSFAAIGAVKRPPRLQYTLQDCGALAYGYSEPADINNRGDVVGWTWSEEGDQVGFLWSKGVMRELPGTTLAASINEAGSLIGGLYFKDVPGQEWGVQSGFVWDVKRSRLIDVTASLRNFPQGARVTWVSSITNAGAICGQMHDPAGNWMGITADRRGNAHILPALAGCSDINDSGQVTGVNQNRRPIVMERDGSIKSLPVPAVFAAIDTTAMNSRGDVAGAYRNIYHDPYKSFPLVWERQEDGSYSLTELPCLAGYPYAKANDINSRGQIAGTAILIVPTGPYHSYLYQTPVIWEKVRGRWEVTDLSSTCQQNGDWILKQGIAIASNGSVACKALNMRIKETHAVVLNKNRR